MKSYENRTNENAFIENLHYHQITFNIRYYAICKPMVAQGRCTMTRAKKIVILLWIMAAIFAMPQLYAQVRYLSLVNYVMY